MHRAQRGEHGKSLCRQRQIRRHQNQHQMYLTHVRPELDNSSPPVFKHLIVRPKKELMAEDREREIALENGALLQKMTKMLHRAKPPLLKPSSCASNHRKAFKAQIAHENARIDAENMALLSRLRSKKAHYSSRSQLSDFSKSREYLDRICQNPGGPVTPRLLSPRASTYKGSHTARLPPMSPRLPMPPRVPDSPATTRTARPSRFKSSAAQQQIVGDVEGIEGLNQDELVMLLSIQQPSEMLEKVLAAVLMLVSPYAPHEVDCSWGALQDWIAVIGGPANFMHNLLSFNILTVRSSNAIACDQFLKETHFSPHVLSRISHILTVLYRWVCTAVSSRLAVSKLACDRSKKLRVALDISDDQLRQATAQAVLESFELVAVPEDSTTEQAAELLEHSDHGVLLARVPSMPEEVQGLHEANALPQLVLTDPGEQGGSTRAFTAPEGCIVPDAHALPMSSIDEIEFSITQMIRLGSASGHWPDRRVAVLAPPGSGRRQLCEGIAAQYGLHRVHLGAAGIKEAGAAHVLQSGALAPDDLVAELVGSLSPGEGRGVLLDGLPRTVAQAKMLEEAGWAPQVVLVLEPEQREAGPGMSAEVHEARSKAHKQAHAELMKHYGSCSDVKVISMPVTGGAHLTDTLGNLMLMLETQLPLLAVPHPILLKAAQLPAARTDPPHKLFTTRPPMVDCIASRVLTEALWSKLALVVTPLGTTLDRAILPAAASEHEDWDPPAVGLVCCDEHAPVKLEALYKVVLSELHGCASHTEPPCLYPQKLATLPQLSDTYVHSVCVSGRRNLAGLPLLASMSRDEIRQTQQLLTLSMNDLGTNYNGTYTPLGKGDTHLDAMQHLGEDWQLHCSAAVDEQLIERAELNRGGSSGRGGWVCAEGQSVVWMNQQDQLLMFGFEASPNAQAAFGRFVSLESAVEECVETRGGSWMHSPQYGFLTTSPQHWGTGLQVSFSCTLPRLCESNALEAACEQLKLRDCTPASLGEEGFAAGVVLLCSSAVFGVSEVALMQATVGAVAELIQREEELESKYDAASPVQGRHRPGAPEEEADKEPPAEVTEDVAAAPEEEEVEAAAPEETAPAEEAP